MKQAIVVSFLLVLIISSSCQKEVAQVLDTPSDSLSISGFSPDTAQAGTFITIKGQGFAPSVNSNIVTINGVQQQVLQATDSLLIVQIVTGTVSGKIVVKANNQETRSKEDLIISSSTLLTQ